MNPNIKQRGILSPPQTKKPQMKTRLALLSLLVFVPLSALAVPAPEQRVPDAGSTLLLLTAGVAVLAGIKRFSKDK
jgi:hypothetical protein